MLKFFMSRRILVVLFLLFSFYVSPVSAQNNAPVSPVQSNIIKDKQDARREGGNQEAWLNESMGSNLVSTLNALVGDIPDEVLEGKIPITGYIPGGALGITTKLTSALYAPAMGVSGIQYIANMGKDFLGKPAYAQANGVGLVGLQPILPIWRGFRNFTYLFASVIFVLIGIMIMLRVKISNQAVISIQSAVPQIITTLVLITFSYAIAGLVIDFMQFIQSFVIALLFNATGTGLSTTLFKSIFGNNFGSNYDYTSLSTADMSSIWGLTQRAVPMAPLVIFSSIFGLAIGSFFNFGVGTAIGGVLGPVVVLLVIIICMLVWMFKFYFGCLKCYITAIFKIIIGPLEIAMGAFPNSKMGFNSWIWDIIANLSVFPISVIFLVIGNLLIDYSQKGLWEPSIINGNSLISGLAGTAVWIGTFGGQFGNIVSIGIGLSVVALVSKLPEMIPQFVFMIKPSPWEQAVGQTMSGWGSAPGRLMATGQQLGETGYAAYSFGRDIKSGNIGRGIQGMFGGRYRPSTEPTPKGKSPGDKNNPAPKRNDISNDFDV